MKRIKNKEYETAKWYRFVEGKVNRNAIYDIRMSMERMLEMQRIFNCFIDYTEVYGRVRHEDIFEILDTLHIDCKDLRVRKTLS